MEKNSVARIGRITMKAGANVVRLPLPQHDKNKSDFARHAREIGEMIQPGELTGWVIVAWREDGSYIDGFLVGGERSPVGPGMAPSFVADVLRRRMILEGCW